MGPISRARFWKCIAIGLPLAIVLGIVWNVVRETPEEAIERLGGKVGKQYRGPAWVPAFLNYVPSGERLVEKFSVVDQISLGGVKLSEEDVRQLRLFPELRNLTLGETGITDDGLKSIAGLANLQNLSLAGEDIGDAGLVHVGQCPRLSGLSLAHTRVTGGGLQHLRGLSELRYVSLAGTLVRGPGLSYLAALPKLEQLDLSSTPIVDADMEHLRGLSAFTLILRDTQITESGLSWLNRENGIVGLDLTGTQVTDGVFRHFLTYPQLGRVNLGNTHVTPAGIEAFFQQTTLIDVRLE